MKEIRLDEPLWISHAKIDPIVACVTLEVTKSTPQSLLKEKREELAKQIGLYLLEKNLFHKGVTYLDEQNDSYRLVLYVMPPENVKYD